jgi:membrane protease YdiL (CAAX protease family)
MRPSFPPEPAHPSHPPPPPDKAVKPMSAFGAGVATFGATALFLFLVITTYKLRPSAEADVINAFACQAVAYLVALFAILRIYASEVSIRALIGLRRTHAGIYPLAIALGVAVGLPANFLYERIIAKFPRAPDEGGIEKVFHDASSGKRVALGLVIVVLGPLLEEVFFRGALFRPLRARHGVKLACLTAGVYFGLAHTAEWQSQLPIAMVGVALCFVRQWGGALGPAFAMHAAFNAVGLAQLALAPRLDFLDAPKPAWIVVGTAVSAVCLVAIARIGKYSGAGQIARQRDLEEV